MTRNVKRIVKITLGWIFIVLGVLGLFLPILQGILFLCIGLTLLAQEQVWAHKLVKRIRHRFPKTARKFDEGTEKSKQIWTNFMASWWPSSRTRRIRNKPAPPQNDKSK